jgi:hypothetical protein
MELRGDSGHGVPGLAPGEAVPGLAPGQVERPPGPAPSPGDITQGSLSPAHTAGGATPDGGREPASGREAAGGRPATGDARVDEAVARLTDLAELVVAEHPAVFEYVHERLTEALGDLDVHDPAGPGGPGGTGGAGGHVPGPRAPGG